MKIITHSRRGKAPWKPAYAAGQPALKEANMKCAHLHKLFKPRWLWFTQDFETRENSDALSYLFKPQIFQSHHLEDEKQRDNIQDQNDVKKGKQITNEAWRRRKWNNMWKNW